MQPRGSSREAFYRRLAREIGGSIGGSGERYVAGGTRRGGKKVGALTDVFETHGGKF